MTHPHLPYYLAALHLPDVGPRTIAQWLEYFPNMEALFSASVDDWISADISEKNIRSLKNPDWKSVDKALTWAQGENCHILCCHDPNYPRLLSEIYDPPILLFVKGNMAALNTVQIAIVGARNATTYGLRNAEQFAYFLSTYGLTITSGFALGIDGASHKGALRANGLTIGVSGTGLNHIYPASHRSLVNEILEQNGTIISEFSLDTMPRASHFPRRNRIIGGLSIGVLVIEAALKSGSLITARHAIEQGREVFAIPGSIHHPLARGCHHLIRLGAKLVEKGEDIMEELTSLKSVYHFATDQTHPQAVENKSVSNEVPIEFQQILQYIGLDATPIDVILLRSGLTAGEVSAILLSLELNGNVQAVAGGYVRLP